MTTRLHMKPIFIFIALTSHLFAQDGALDPERIANTVVLTEASAQNLRIETAVAEERDFESTVFAVGRIEEIPANRAALSTRIAGRVVSLDVYEGDQVEEGQVLARIESLQPGDPPPTIKAAAPRTGLVTVSHIRLGQPVEPGNELMEIVDRSTMWAIAQIPEQEASRMAIGTLAHIRVPALGDERFEATLSRYGTQANRESSTVEGIFELKNPQGRLQPGMRAEFDLVTGTKNDVLAIPRTAVQGSEIERIVFYKDFEIPNTFVKTPVVLGERNEQFVEVISGLFPGDEVVTTGSYPLSFAGGGGGSLKDALDAAHGHEHNEDGSEVTDEKKEESAEDHEAHAGESAGLFSSTPLLIWAITATVLFIIAAQLFWNKSRQLKNQTSSSHA